MSNAIVCDQGDVADSNPGLLALVDELEAFIEIGDLGGIIEAAAAIRRFAAGEGIQPGGETAGRRRRWRSGRRPTCRSRSRPVLKERPSRAE